MIPHIVGKHPLITISLYNDALLSHLFVLYFVVKLNFYCSHIFLRNGPLQVIASDWLVLTITLRTGEMAWQKVYRASWISTCHLVFTSPVPYDHAKLPPQIAHINPLFIQHYYWYLSIGANSSTNSDVSLFMSGAAGDLQSPKLL